MLPQLHKTTNKDGKAFKNIYPSKITFFILFCVDLRLFETEQTPNKSLKVSKYLCTHTNPHVLNQNSLKIYKCIYIILCALKNTSIVCIKQKAQKTGFHSTKDILL